MRCDASGSSPGAPHRLRAAPAAPRRVRRAGAAPRRVRRAAPHHVASVAHHVASGGCAPLSRPSPFVSALTTQTGTGGSGCARLRPKRAQSRKQTRGAVPAQGRARPVDASAPPAPSAATNAPRRVRRVCPFGSLEPVRFCPNDTNGHRRVGVSVVVTQTGTVAGAGARTPPDAAPPRSRTRPPKPTRPPNPTRPPTRCAGFAHPPHLGCG